MIHTQIMWFKSITPGVFLLTSLNNHHPTCEFHKGGMEIMIVAPLTYREGEVHHFVPHCLTRHSLAKLSDSKGTRLATSNLFWVSSSKPYFLASSVDVNIFVLYNKTGFLVLKGMTKVLQYKFKHDQYKMPLHF